MAGLLPIIVLMVVVLFIDKRYSRYLIWTMSLAIVLLLPLYVLGSRSYFTTLMTISSRSWTSLGAGCTAIAYASLLLGRLLPFNGSWTVYLFMAFILLAIVFYGMGCLGFGVGNKSTKNK